MNTNYVGITYPKVFQNKFVRWFWKKFMCPRNMHLFDECMSSEHTLDCDCCDLIVFIACTNSNDEYCKLVREGKYIKTSFTIERNR